MEHRKLIEDLGGPAVVAGLLGYDKSAGGVQRVFNWLSRGIPPRVLIDHPDVFGAAGRTSDQLNKPTTGKTRRRHKRDEQSEA